MQLISFQSYLFLTINSYAIAIKRTAIRQALVKYTSTEPYTSTNELIINARKILKNDGLTSLDAICTHLFGAEYVSYARDFAKLLVQNGVSFTNVKKALWENQKGVLIQGNEDVGLKSWGDLNDPQIFEYAKAYTAIIRQKIEDQNNHV